jgi:hypothetical protein
MNTSEEEHLRNALSKRNSGLPRILGTLRSYSSATSQTKSKYKSARTRLYFPLLDRKDHQETEQEERHFNFQN